MKEVIVSQDDIDALEKARKRLFALLDTEETKHLIGLFQYNVAPAMWKVTHRKYKEYNPNKKELLLTAALNTAMNSLSTYGEHPIVESFAERALGEQNENI